VLFRSVDLIFLLLSLSSSSPVPRTMRLSDSALDVPFSIQTRHFPRFALLLLLTSSSASFVVPTKGSTTTTPSFSFPFFHRCSSVRRPVVPTTIYFVPSARRRNDQKRRRRRDPPVVVAGRSSDRSPLAVCVLFASIQVDLKRDSIRSFSFFFFF
jgi:hypothetical protein